MPREPFDTISRKRTRIPSELMEEIEMTRTAHTDRTADLVGDLEAEFDSILAGHDANLDAAVEFGMRSARRRASTRNLMPYPDAKKIVDGFARDTDKLYDFLGKIEVAQRAAPDEATKKAIGRISAKAYAQVRKFEADKKKADTALKRWGELITGEKFQALFQEVRMAVVKAKPNDPDGIDFEVEEFLNPGKGQAPYALGRILIGPTSKPLYTLVVGYRAGTNEYWGSLKAGYKTFESIAAKAKGQTPRQFARKMVDLLMVYSKENGNDLFGSRRALPSLMSSALSQSLREELEKAARSWNFPEYAKVGWKADGLQSRSVLLSWSYQYSRGVPGLVGLEQAFKEAYETALQAKTLPNWNRRAVAKTVDTVSETREVRVLEYRLCGSRHRSVRVTKFATWRNRMAAEGSRSLLVFGDPNPEPESTQEHSFLEAESFRGQCRSGTARDDRGSVAVPDFGEHLESGHLHGEVQEGIHRPRRRPSHADGGFRVLRGVRKGGDPNRVFRRLREDALHEHGHDYYGGHIGLKDGWKYQTRTPVGSIKEARDLANSVYNRYDKWGDAGCIPVAERQVKSSDKVTVKVKANNAKKAEAEGRLLIKATGPIRPKVKVTVENIKVKKVGGARTYPEWEVSGDRVQAVVGQVTGFLFFGWAPS